MTTSPSFLREKCNELLERGAAQSAAYLAELLISGNDAASVEDVLLLSRCYSECHQYRRAVHLLETHKILDRYECLCAAAQCLFRLEDYDKCLAMIDEFLPKCQSRFKDENTHESKSRARRTRGSKKKEDEEKHHNDVGSLLATLYCVKGKCFLALEQRDKAAEALTASLENDVFHAESFELLADSYVLSEKQSSSMLKSLLQNENNSSDDAQRLLRLYAERMLVTLDPATASTIDIEDASDDRSLHHLVNCATSYFHRGLYRQAYEHSQRVLQKDPYCKGFVLTVHISSMVELKLTNELFFLTHKLVDVYGKDAISYYAIGSYYFSVNDFENARKYLAKATTCDAALGPAWIAFGHAFAGQGESDQALAAYRTAYRLMIGCYSPALCIGMEYLRISHYALALQFLSQALRLMSSDAVVHNEMGCALFGKGDVVTAKRFFTKAIQLSASKEYVAPSETYLCATVNLGHCHRRLKDYSAARSCYQSVMASSPQHKGVHTALAYTLHLMGELEEAIRFYHQALAIRPDDSFAVDLLNEALEEQTLSFNEWIDTQPSVSKSEAEKIHPPANLVTTNP